MERMEGKRMMSFEERADLLTGKYGECCRRSVAAKILDCSTGKIRNMIEDGRLELVCEGERIDVRSIARYMCKPKAADWEVKKKRIAEKYNSRWAV